MYIQSVARRLSVTALLVAAAALASLPSAADVAFDPQDGQKVVDELPETILLVSLDDGTIVMQKIRSSADICFKQNSDSATTCLTQGAPVVDPESNAVIGFEMIEETIQLVAKTR